MTKPTGRARTKLRTLGTAVLTVAAATAGLIVTEAFVRSAPASGAAPPFNVIQFFDYCKATSTPTWCSAPGIYQVGYPLNSKSVPHLLLGNGAGYTSQWSADGSKMVYEYGTYQNPGTAGEFLSVQGLGIMTSNGSTTSILSDPNVQNPSISPDGTEVVYAENSGLWVIGTSSGSLPSELGNSSSVCGQLPFWASAAGKPGTNGLIVFEQCHAAAAGPGNNFLATVDPTKGTSATTTPVTVNDTSSNANLDGIGGSPSASPDGNTYYFSGGMDGTEGLFSVVAATGAVSSGPTMASQNDFNPLPANLNGLYGEQLGPNGHLLYYDEYAPSGSGVGKTFVDGASGQLPITDPNAEFDPTWAPGGGTPTVDSVSLNQGPVVGGQTVTINGIGLTGATEVDFLSTNTSDTATNPATPSSVSDTQLTVNAPNLTASVNAAGGTADLAFDVVVKTPGGTSAVTPAKDTYTAKVPIVTGVNTKDPTTGTPTGPAAGPVKGTETVVLTGTWLNGVTEVGLQPVSNIAFATATTNVSGDGKSLTFTAPDATSEYAASGATGDLLVDLIVSIPVNGKLATITSNSVASGANDKFYLVPVSVTDLSTHTSPVLGNGSVTITGVGLANGTVILAPPQGSAPGSGCDNGSPMLITPQAGGTSTSLTFLTQGMSSVMAKTKSDVVCDVEVQVPVPEVQGATVTSPPNPGSPGDTLTFPFPKILDLSIHQGLDSGGALMTITGSGFTGVSNVEFVFTGFATPPLNATPISVLDGAITVNVPSALLAEATLGTPLPVANVQVQIPEPPPNGFITSEASASDPHDQFQYLTPGATAPPCNTLNDCKSGSNTSPSGAASATSTTPTGSIMVKGNGVGGITVGRYAADPVGTPSFSVGGTYFDVRVSNPNSFTSATILDCDLGGAAAIQWWNPTGGSGTGAWQAVSNETFSAGPPACVTVTVNATTSPTLSQMLGTVFVERIPKPLAKLAFSTEPPSSVAAGSTFSVKVALKTLSGGAISISGFPVLLAITPGTGSPGAVLTCATNPGKTSSGVATFSCSVNLTGVGYTLTASVLFVTQAVSTPFSVTAPKCTSGRPCPPTNLNVTVSGATVTLTWVNSAGTKGVNVYRNGTKFWAGGSPNPPPTSLVQTNVPAGKYTYTVAAYNSYGQGALSPGVTVTVP